MLKLVHFLRDEVFENIPIAEGVNLLLEANNLIGLQSEDPGALLEQLREIDQQ